MSYTYQPSTIPLILDALLKLVAGLSSCQPPVVIFDGQTGPNAPDTYVQIGSDVTDAADGNEGWAGLGGAASRRTEKYEVACSISVAVEGQNLWSDAPAGGDSQLTARTAAFAIYTDISTALRNDPAFQRGQPTSLLASGWAGISGISYHQTLPSDPESGKGSIAQIDFRVLITNELGPLTGP